jgi:hypothetical protein
VSTSLLQDLRYKLQKRVQRLSSARYDGIRNELVRFFEFLEGNPTLNAVAQELMAKFPRVGEEFDAALTKRQVLEGSTEEEHAAIGLNVLRRVAVSTEQIPYLSFVPTTSHFDKALDLFRDRYLDPFYEYVDERIEDRNLVLSELIRFKHLAEWFRREELWSRWKSEPRSGERTLAFAVYEFLYQQGIEFHIEPASASGEVDMVSAQQSQAPLVADVKIYDPDSGRGATYIRRGFYQVYRYLHDFNQPIGYLVVFKGSEKLLTFSGAANNSENVPYVVINDKTIFLVQIDIFPHEQSASKRAVPEQDVISEAELAADIEADPTLH